MDFFAAWKKTDELKPGEKQTVELLFLLTDLASYDEELAAWILEKGEYILRLGNSSRDTEVCGIILVPETLNTKSVKNCLGKPDGCGTRRRFSLTVLLSVSGIGAV